MTVREAIITLNANVVFACGRAGFDSATVRMVEDALDTIEDALKAQEPRTCSECRHYDTNAFIDMGGKCRNSRSCHYCYGCGKSFGCNAWEGR